MSEKYLSYNSRCIVSQKPLGLELNYMVLIKEMTLPPQDIKNNTRLPPAPLLPLERARHRPECEPGSAFETRIP